MITPRLWGTCGAEQLIVSRAWARPSPQTFVIWPIAEVLRRHLTGGVIVDPFAGNARVATLTNDLNPHTAADSHVDALVFCEALAEQGITADRVLFDPPYSPRQMAECYASIGLPPQGQRGTQNAQYSRVKNVLASLVKPQGVAICCGWSTHGFGRRRGFELVELLIVVHGSAHHDTLVTVERKEPSTQQTLWVG